MAQMDGNKSVAHTADNEEDEEDFGPQLIKKLEVSLPLLKFVCSIVYYIVVNQFILVINKISLI